MEEWVGLWWHRFITRAADDRYPEAAVTLDAMQRSVRLLLHAGCADATMGARRVVAGSAQRHNGPRGWLQKVAGTGKRATLARLDDEALALPPSIDLFADAALNRDLYLWLAALAAVYRPGGGWLADNVAATHAALAQFPGLATRHAALLQAHLAQRPQPERLPPAQADAERCIRAALTSTHGNPSNGTANAAPHSTAQPPAHPTASTAPPHAPGSAVAPVWLWLHPSAGDANVATAAATANPAAREQAANNNPNGPTRDAQRRQARRVQNPDARRALILPARTESLPSWSEFVQLDRATDDEPDDQALAAANDMDTLAIAPGDARTAARVRFDLDLPSAAADDLPLGPGVKTPEWDWKRRVLLPDHCAVTTLVARDAAPYLPPTGLRRTARSVRRKLEVLRHAPRWQRAQESGDQLDLDAWVRFRGADRTGQSATPPVYRRSVAQERSLATLLLADLSLSTDAYATADARVIDVIREALYVFGEALSAVGDPFEMLGFSSVRRQHVRLQHLKGFDEVWSDAARARVGALRPGFYTRMGAAVRDATRRLQQRPERKRLLLLLTDGKPNDLDVYEGRYGLEDTRHAIGAARDAGLTPFCVTIDEKANDYLPTLFSQHGYAWVRRPQELVHRLTQVWLALAR